MSNLSKIEWRPIPNIPDYEVSTVGSIRRSSPGKSTRVGRELRLQITADGYCFVMIRRRKVKVYRAMLEAFVGPAPDGCEGRHLDGVPGHNILSNLAWGTRLDQREDDRRNGVQRRRSDCLAPGSIRAIRNAPGTLREVGQRFGVSHSTVHKIRTGVRYSDVG